MGKASYHHGDLKNALIHAGIEILASEGMKGLSLRKVARIANVSHAAPYAHFTDKQALVAAISTEGLHRLHEKIQTVIEHFESDPLRQLIEIGWVYVSFALASPAHFKIIFSSMVEQEWNYPALVDISQASFQSLLAVVERCQAAGFLAPGSSEILAVAIWGQVHGLISLILENQIPNALLERISKKALLIACLQQIVKVTIPSEYINVSSV